MKVCFVNELDFLKYFGEERNFSTKYANEKFLPTEFWYHLSDGLGFF